MSIRRLALFVLVGAMTMVPSFLLAQQSAPANSNEAQEVLKLNGEMVAAEAKADLATLSRFYADDFVHTSAAGFIEPRAQYMEELKSGVRKYRVMDLSDVKVQFYGQTAILVGHQHIVVSFKGRPEEDNRNVFWDVWIKQNGAWKCVGWATIHDVSAMPAKPENK